MKILIYLFLLVGCTNFGNDTLIINVVDSVSPQNKVSNIAVFLEGKKIGQTSTSGELKFTLIKPHLNNIYLSFSDNDNNSYFLPTWQKVFIKDSMFSQEVMVNVRMPHIPNAENKAIEIVSEVVLVATATPLAWQESDLAPEPSASPASKAAMPGSFAKPGTNSLLAQTPSVVSIPITKITDLIPAVQAQPLLDALLFKVSSEAKPLSQAKIYLGRLAHKMFVYAGSTNSDGKLSLKIPSILKGETVLIEHPCCKSELRPLTAQNEINIVLQPPAGKTVTLRYDGYGVSRVISGLEVLMNGKHLQTATQSGLAILDFVPASPLELKSSQVFPEVITIKSNTFQGYAGTKIFTPPVVALCDLTVEANGQLSVQPLWRRFRREFLALLMQNAALKPMVDSEFKRVMAAVQLSARDFLAKGWQFTLANPDVDFVLALEFLNNTVEINLADRLANKYLIQKIDINSGVPEMLAQVAAKDVLLHLPLEGTVLASAKNMLTVNMGSKHGISKSDKFAVYAWGEQGFAGERNVLYGDATVKLINSEQSELILVNNLESKIPLGARIKRVVRGNK